MPTLKTMHVWLGLCLLLAFVCLSSAQTPCQITNCPSNTYCAERPDGSTTCTECDVACIGCDGPGPERCLQCKIGYVKPLGLLQPCQPCPVGNFGVNCSSQCHCLNNELCNKTNGNCNGWKCDRGYTGLPQCQELCPVGTFGLDCLYECHCPENDNCSHINGDCSSGKCHPEWGSSGCQRRLPKLALPPEIVAVRCGNITLTWDRFNDTNDIGQGPVGEYRLYMKLNHTESNADPPWVFVNNINVASSSGPKYKYSVLTNLLPDAEYNFRVDVIGLDFGKLMSRVSAGTKSDIVMNSCTTTTTPEPESTTKYIIARKVFERVTITSPNSTSIRIEWVVLPELRQYSYNITIAKKLLGNGDCDNVTDGLVEMYGPLGINADPVGFYNILSWSRYQFSINVAALAGGDIRENYVQEMISQATVPSGTVTGVTVRKIRSAEAEVSWGPVVCSERKGPLQRYDISLTANSPSSTTLYNTTETRLSLENLQPYTNFSVQIRYINSVGNGPFSQPVMFQTLEGVPGPVEILQLIPTYSTITAVFQPPIELNGVLQSYTLMYSENNIFEPFETVSIAATDRLNLTVHRLIPETVYFVKMAASTGGGLGQYGADERTETLKAPPAAQDIALNLVSKTTTCLTVEWVPPNVTEAQITSYLLELRRADVISPPITYLFGVDKRRHQQCQLRPSSLYIVTISGVNVDGVVTSTEDNFSTAQGTPPKPVAPVYVRSTYTNITIAVEPVVSLDVPITAYQIQVHKDAAGRKKRWSELPGVVAAELNPENVTQRMEFVVGDGLTYGGYENQILERETYYMIYYVVLSTLNNKTTGASSQLKAAIRTVPFDTALAPPLSITLTSKNTTCLDMAWEVPDTINAVITGYTLVMRKTGGDNDFVATRELPATAQSFQQCNLSPYTLYTTSISAKTDNGMLTTASETFTTVHTAPRTPVAPVFVNSTYTSIAVAIEPVVLTTAPLTAYQLQVEKVSGKRRKRQVGLPGYVAAQLTQNDVPQKMNFVVGNGREYGGYTNQPLERETLYRIHYVVISNASNIIKYSFSSLDPPVRTVPFVPAEPSSGDDSDDGVLIGVIVALVLFLLIVFLIILLYWWWRRKNRFNPYEIQEDDKIVLPEFKDDYDPEKYWSQIVNVKDSRHIVAGRDLVYGGGQQGYINGEPGFSPEQPRVSFKDEFHNLPHKSKRATDNMARNNSRLNRFPHLLPYDHSLVKLKPDGNSNRTYINASFIPGYKKTPAYIAAQSPFDEETVLDFWRLIYQRSVKTVVMITNIVEDNIVKCTQYWPDQTKASYGHFLLHLRETTEYADYIIRTIEIKASGSENPKIVRLFEFTSWPDHGVPDDPIPFLEMRYKVRRYHNDDASPILVHCGTGMARTGVFIAVDTLIDQYAAEGRVMVFDYVRRVRKDRPYMVRTQKQYTFIYEAIFEEYHAGDTLVDFDLKERYHNWTQKNPRTDHTYLRDQYRLLENFTRGPRKDECKTGLLEVNIQKNRYIDVIPADKHRPMLKSLGGPNATDYINALFVDGYMKKNQFIITQTPLAITIMDFWKLVYDHDVRTIVMVENAKNEDDSCAEYWPNVNLKQFEPFFIETTATYQHDNITIRNFKIFSTQHPKQPAKFVRQFQFNAWATPNLTPQSKTMMLDLIDSVYEWQEEACQNERPIIVHCQDGSSHSGLFAIICNICERMEEDDEVDVYRTIKHCKRRRPQFIADYEQFRFCYKTLWDFMNLRMPGGTFTDTLGQNKSDKAYGAASLSLTSYFDQLNDNNTTEL